MNQEINIVYKPSMDGFISSLNDAKNRIKGLTKEVSNFEKVKDKVLNSKIDFKLDITNVKKTMKEFENVVSKSIESTEKKLEGLIGKFSNIDIGFEVNTTESQLSVKDYSKTVDKSMQSIGNKFKKQTECVSDLEFSYKKLYKQIKFTTKSQNQLLLETNKADNMSDSRGALISSFFQTGLGSMIGGSVANLGEAYLSSAVGSRKASAVTNVVSSTVQGALMGSGFGPYGIIAGAGIGLITSVMNNIAQDKKHRDDLFRDEVKNIYKTVEQIKEKAFNTGIDTAASEEKYLVFFKSFFDRNSNEISYMDLQGKFMDSQGRVMDYFIDIPHETSYENFMDKIINFSIETPYEKKEVFELSKSLLTKGFNADDIIPYLTNIGNISYGLGLSDYERRSFTNTMVNIHNSDKLSMNDINNLKDYNIDGKSILGQKRKKTKDEITDMISDGEITGEDAFNDIIESMGSEYEGEMTKYNNTYEVALQNYREQEEEITKSYGESHNLIVKEGLKEIIDYLKGSTGDDLSKLYRRAGQNDGNIEKKELLSFYNILKRKDIQKDINYAITSDDPSKSSEVLSKINAAAIISFKDSKLSKDMLDSHINIVKDIQDELVKNHTYLDFGTKMADEFSKGFDAAKYRLIKNESCKVSKYILENIYMNTFSLLGRYLIRKYASYEYNGNNTGNGRAIGLDRVPRTGIYLLHEGEKVTARHDIDGKSINTNVNISVTNTDKKAIVKEVAFKLGEALDNLGVCVC